MPVPSPSGGSAGFPLVKFVAAPEVAAAVRFDCNVQTPGDRVHVRNDGFDLGVPELVGDPDGVEVEYGLRTVSFTLRVEGPKPAALTLQSAVARELMRAENWLMVQLSADTAPVWFRLYRAEPGALSFEEVYDPDSAYDVWDIGVALPAEPFAYGARITLPQVTIANDPAAATNPTRYVLPPVVGDAPAPLRLKVDPSHPDHTSGYRFMFSMLSAAAEPAGPIVWQIGDTDVGGIVTADGWTAGTDTTASETVAGYSGGSRRSVTFTSFTTMTDRLWGVAPAVLPAGKYKVLVRVGRTDINTTFGLRLEQGAAPYEAAGDTVLMDRAPSTAAHFTWVDLGAFTFPRGHAAPEGQNGTPSAPYIALGASRLSGTGQLRLDAFLLVPLDVEGGIEVRTLFVEFPLLGIPASNGYAVFDGDTEAAWGFNGDGTAANMPTEMQGQFPIAVPGAANVLHLLQQVNGRQPGGGTNPDASDAIGRTTAVTISYHPRWLWIGEG